MPYTFIKVSYPHPEVAEIMLTRPDKRNALNVDLLEELLDALTNQPTHIRGILLTGEGPAFCTGMDLNESGDQTIAKRSANLLAQVFSQLHDSPLVTLAAVQGATFAGGAGLMLACDGAVGTPDLQVAFPETKRGLVAIQVMTLMRRKISGSDMRKLLLFGQTLDAAQAHQIGLTFSTFPLNDLHQEALKMLLQALLGGPEAVRTTKMLLNKKPIAEDLQLAAKIQLSIRLTSEAQEGAKAFLEKRAPLWLAAEPLE